MMQKDSKDHLHELPARALSALDEQRVLVDKHFRALLPKILEEAEEDLFRQANQSRNNTEQEQCLDSVRELKRCRREVTVQTLQELAERLSTFGKPALAEARHSTHVGLELLAEQTQDQTIIVDDIIARAESRATMVLFELGHRYAVLGASPILETEQQPFGPATICRCLQHAVSQLSIAPEHQVLIYRAFDRGAMANIVALYDELNEKLIARGILPNLRTYAPRRKGDNSAPGSEPESPETESPEGEPTDAPQSRRRRTAMAQPQAEDPYAGTGPASNDDHETFEALTELLALRRRQTGPVTPRGKRRAPTSEDLHKVLGELQHRASTEMSGSGKLQPRSMQHLRRDMLAQLRQASADGSAPHFAPAQLDVIELMTLLFDRLGEDIRSSSGNYLLSELQAPLLRVAMDDKEFFTRRDHPARRWLNTVAEASARWGSDGDDGDPALIERIHGMTRRINRDFDGDTSLFTGLSDDLQQQLDSLAHKATVTERRFIEASKGRERLDIARRRAEDLITERLQSTNAPSLTRTLLQHAWTDVLALTLLRKGEDSDDFRQQLHIADVLVKGDTVPTEDDLRSEIEQGLTQVGMPEKEADLLAREATGQQNLAPGESTDDQLTRTELAMKLKQRKRIGVDQATEEQPAPPAPLDDEHLQTVEQIKQMAFGTWFEFDDIETGQPVRRKMAWFSTRTGRCLFVNQRGVRTDDTTIEQLAQSMVAGTVRLPPPEKGSLIDRAWDAILDKLKRITSIVGPGTGESEA